MHIIPPICGWNQVLFNCIFQSTYHVLSTVAHTLWSQQMAVLHSSLPFCSARKSKTHIFLPRVVVRDGESGGGKKEEGSGGDTKTKMSNEDFRKLLTEK